MHAMHLAPYLERSQRRAIGAECSGLLDAAAERRALALGIVKSAKSMGEAGSIMAT